MLKTADISACGNYRYNLSRIWNTNKSIVMYIGINPNTADHLKDDPTINRLRIFSENFGYGGFIVTNLFAWRSKNPEDLKKVKDPIGKLNDENIERSALLVKDIVFMWGNKGLILDRDKKISSKYPNSLCFGHSKQRGNPKHPLYLPKNTVLVKFNPELLNKVL